MYLYKCGIIELQSGKHEVDYWYDDADQSLIHFKLKGEPYCTSYKSVIKPGTPVKLFNLEQAIQHIAKHFPAYDQYTKAENWEMVAKLIEMEMPITEGQLNAITSR